MLSRGARKKGLAGRFDPVRRTPEPQKTAHAPVGRRERSGEALSNGLDSRPTQCPCQETVYDVQPTLDERPAAPGKGKPAAHRLPGYSLTQLSCQAGTEARFGLAKPLD